LRPVACSRRAPWCSFYPRANPRPPPPRVGASLAETSRTRGDAASLRPSRERDRENAPLPVAAAATATIVSEYVSAATISSRRCRRSHKRPRSPRPTCEAILRLPAVILHPLISSWSPPLRPAAPSSTIRIIHRQWLLLPLPCFLPERE
jgi:hypothetical protein